VKRKLKSLQLQSEQRKRYWKTDNVVEVQRHLRNEFGTPARTWVNITKSGGTPETDGMVKNVNRG
jgi:hypothetical protein